MSPEFWRFLLVAVAIMAFFRWSRGGRRWRRRWDRMPMENSASREELSSIDSRLSVVEQLESRVAELENRLDFTERLLSNRSSPDATTPR